MNRFIAIAITLFVCACGVNTSQTKTLQLNYSDFGPQAMAYEMLGNKWWQWQNHGDSQPKDYKIEVIVYRHIPLTDVQKAYPVIPAKEQDFRYITYQQAITYLDHHIQENMMESITAKLKRTRSKLMDALDKK